MHVVSSYITQNNKIPFFSSFKHNIAKLRYQSNDCFIKKTKQSITTREMANLNAVDYKYKKTLLSALGLTGVSAIALQSVMGPQEFCAFVEKHNDDPEFYSPGTRPEDKKDVNDSFPLTNVKNRKFGANLHIHTTESDGKMTVEELLDQANEYANLYFQKNNAPFTIAITDHNTANGCKKVIEILTKNPDKYKNLRVVLGAEISAKEDEIYGYRFKKPEKFHILTMCINPYDEQFNNFIEDINIGKKGVMNPRTIRLSEVVKMMDSQPNTFLCYAHPAWPDLTHRINNTNDDYCKLIQKCIKFFTEQAGNKALYAEHYYGGYAGNLAVNQSLHNAISEAIEEMGLKKAGGMDTHGNSIFYNGQIIKNKI